MAASSPTKPGSTKEKPIEFSPSPATGQEIGRNAREEFVNVSFSSLTTKHRKPAIFTDFLINITKERLRVAELEQQAIERQLKYRKYTEAEDDMYKKAIEGVFEYPSLALGTSLHIDSFKTLLSNSWLNDEVINGYGHLLQNRQAMNPTLPYCLILSTLVGSRQKQVMEDAWERAKPNLVKTHHVNVPYYKFIICPVNKYGNHWILLVFDMDRSVSRCTVYDSLISVPESFVEDVKVYTHIRFLLTAISSSRGAYATWIGLSTPEPVKYETRMYRGSRDQLSTGMDWLQGFNPRQVDSVNCGVFCCQAMEHVTRGALPVVDYKFIQPARKRIAIELLSGKMMLPFGYKHNV